ncbi:MAG: DUF4491 family protein [Clostridiales bacterium]|jgi:hypothetical protein|nr:DUF4491 family protein [Clostridiales bacterium]
MNITGIVIGLASFVIIGIFHPIVIKTEYHFGKRVWPAFLALGIAACAASVLITYVLVSNLCSVVGFTAFWSIKELHEQEQRVKKGWFPANPKFSTMNLEGVRPSLYK